VTQQAPRTWRAVRGRRAALTAACVILVGAVVLGVSLPAPYKGGDQVGVALSGLPVAAVLWLLARPSITADDEGLFVRNLVRARRLSWAEVVSIRLGPDDSWASIDVSDGTSLPVMALQTADRAHTTRALAELTRLLHEAESAGD
jgi:hypothetical protein